MKAFLLIALLLCLLSCKSTSLHLDHKGAKYVRTVDQKMFLRDAFEIEKINRKKAIGGKLKNQHMLSRYVFDFISSDMSIKCNGSRNLMAVGIVNEKAFKAISSSMKTWELRTFGDIAKEAGVNAKDMRLYWSPTSIKLEQGLMFATRLAGSSDIGALVFVKLISKNHSEILIETNPKAF